MEWANILLMVFSAVHKRCQQERGIGITSWE